MKANKILIAVAAIVLIAAAAVFFIWQSGSDRTAVSPQTTSSANGEANGGNNSPGSGGTSDGTQNGAQNGNTPTPYGADTDRATPFKNIDIVPKKDADAVVFMTKARGSAGSEVTVSMKITKNSGLAAGMFVISYDTSKLDYVKGKKGSVALIPGTNSLSDFYHDPSKNTIKMSYINADDAALTGAGSLLDVTFKIKSGASGIIPIKLEVTQFLNTNSETIPIYYESGSVTVD